MQVARSRRRFALEGRVRSRAHRVFLRAYQCLSAVLLLALAACAAGGGGATGPFPRFAEYEGREVDELAFVGDLQLPEDSLRLLITTRASRCRLLFLPICIPFTNVGEEDYRLDLGELARDVVRLQLYYRDHGYYGTRVVPSVDPTEDNRVLVRFAIAPGDQVILTQLAVEGTEGIIDPQQLEDQLALREGEPFGRIGFLSSADTVRSRLYQLGHAYADVLRNYAIDTIADVAEVQFVALPGPLVYVDTILVEGVGRLSEQTLRRQITFREGDLLRAAELNRSQRNIYDIEMVSFASVEIAPDSLQVGSDSARATVLVRVVEAAQYVVEVSGGFGTVDCVRTSGRWVNRNFAGGGRRLELFGSLAKIGAAQPFDANLDASLCSDVAVETFEADETSSSELVDYSVSAGFLQPRLFNTRNQLGVNLHSERLTELQVFLRESTGGQVSLVRSLDPVTVLSVTADVERGRTVASPALLCINFDTCNTEDLATLSDARWSNSVSVTAVRDRTRTAGSIVRGYQVRAGVDWAAELFGSDDEYLRLLAEGSVYRQIRPGWILATNLRLGRFLGGALSSAEDYIPPERRFYAGGPNSVRGYGRNALGPTAWVEQLDDNGDVTVPVPSATGGTQMVVGSVEVRAPSPYFSGLTRVAAFIDAGHVSIPGTSLGVSSVRITPGVGLRVLTPVGPFRLDVAYNGYRREEGPLYRLDHDRGLFLVEDDFQPGPPPFLRRFRFSFAVGQAF